MSEPQLNIVKFGGSIVNPDGKYNNQVINDFADLVKETGQRFIFVVGGGKICRGVQDASMSHLEAALEDPKEIDIARDRIGIATTQINADYVRRQFQRHLGDAGRIYPEIILDPTMPVQGDYQIYFACGWKPGCSTDKDMMLLAETFNADRVFKISDFPIVKDISPHELKKYSGEDKIRMIKQAPDLPKASWQKLVDLVGTEWEAGLSTPFDPRAAEIGYRLRDKLVVYIGQQQEFPKMLRGEDFIGTIIQK
ncbi:hypothetical protein HN587_08060 [Candidatus Woesearchaeota archaeon]|jgi:uridylate kinase|nr:hypothetical protein [Candidatus Woesearchaeota archaeon]